MTDNNWLIMAVPGWLFGAAFIFFAYHAGVVAVISTPVGLQFASIGLIWGVIVPFLVWKG